MKSAVWLQDVLRVAKIVPGRENRQASLEAVPEWVQRIDEELERRNFPVRIEKGERLTPRKLGQLLGQSFAYFGWLLDCLRRENSALSDRFHQSAREFFESDYDADVESSMRTFMDS